MHHAARRPDSPGTLIVGSGGSNFFVLAFLPGLHAFVILPDFRRQVESHWVRFMDTDSQRREDAIFGALDRGGPPSVADMTIPFTLRRVIWVLWWIEASKVERARATITAEQLAVSTTSSARVPIFMALYDISFMCLRKM